MIVAAVFSSRMFFDSNPYGGCSPTLHFTLLSTLRLKLAISTEQWSRLLNAQFKVVEIVRVPVAVAAVVVVCGVGTSMVEPQARLNDLREVRKTVSCSVAR